MPRLEVKGAAYATIIAKTIEMILFIVYTIKDKPDFVDLSVLKRIDFKFFGQILRKGFHDYSRSNDVGCVRDNFSSNL